MITEFDIQIPPDSLALMERLTPAQLFEGVRQGMNVATPQVLSAIQEERLTGQGPFPVDEHRLGVVSGQLRQSAYTTEAVIEGSMVTSSMGSPLGYASIHERGGVYERTTKPGKVRLRTDRSGNLLKRGNLATFARKTHKQVKEVSFEGGKTYTVTVPARAPFGFGLADHTDLFLTAIARAAVEQLGGNS